MPVADRRAGAAERSNDAPELGEQAWPIRLAMVEGRIYVLR